MLKVSALFFPWAFGSSAYALLKHCGYQLGLAQDIFVIAKTMNNDDNNFFIEFGATDGLINSNTYLLEKELNWNGILIEPAKIWHKNL